MCVIILSSDTKQCVAFSQCTGPVFDFQLDNFPVSEGADVQVCVTINPFDPQTSQQLTIQLTTMDGPKASKCGETLLHALQHWYICIPI